MQILNAASGSSGNATILESGGNRLLIDCGISVKSLVKKLDDKNIPPESLDAILVTHEHSDHISRVFTAARRYKIPVHMNFSTYSSSKVEIGDVNIRFFKSGIPFEVGKMRIKPFSVPHDSADPVAFRIDTDEGVVTVATDIGVPAPSVLKELHGSRAMVLEFNHDRNMLTKGPYPRFLKKRIAGPRGHLSNEEAMDLLWETDTSELELLVLGHLSRKNNLPKLAREKAQEVLTDRCCDAEISIADQYLPRFHEL